MNPRITGACIGIMVTAVFATGIIVFPALPLTMASHWNIAGHANGVMPRVWATFLLPALMLAFWGLWALLPRIDPIALGFRGFRHVYDFFWVLITAFLAYVYALSLGANLGWELDMLRALVPALAVLFFAIGALLPLIKRNWFIGIRTPWSLSDDDVWDRTHRLGSRLFELAGIIVLAALVAPRAAAIWIIITPVLLAALISIVYSYLLLARKRKGKV